MASLATADAVLLGMDILSAIDLSAIISAMDVSSCSLLMSQVRRSMLVTATSCAS